MITLKQAQNPETSPELLSEVLRRGKNDEVSIYAAENHNTSPQALSEILKLGRDDGVSWYAARNPSYKKYLKEQKKFKKEIQKLQNKQIEFPDSISQLEP